MDFRKSIHEKASSVLAISSIIVILLVSIGICLLTSVVGSVACGGLRKTMNRVWAKWVFCDNGPVYWFTVMGIR